VLPGTMINLLQRWADRDTVFFLTGYLLWNLDFIYCAQLTKWKRAIGMPWSFVLEFHGWWHIFTAIGAYIFMVMVDSLTQDVVDLSGGPFAWFNKERRVKLKSTSPERASLINTRQDSSAAN
jgi:hypothetical protein